LAPGDKLAVHQGTCCIRVWQDHQWAVSSSVAVIYWQYQQWHQQSSLATIETSRSITGNGNINGKIIMASSTWHIINGYPAMAPIIDGITINGNITHWGHHYWQHLHCNDHHWQWLPQQWWQHQLATTLATSSIGHHIWQHHLGNIITGNGIINGIIILATSSLAMASSMVSSMASSSTVTSRNMVSLLASSARSINGKHDH
jgi:hypothetical protein